MNPPAHPANLAVFTDGGSLCHLVWGFIAGRLEPVEALALAMAFTGYQVAQGAAGEPWERVGGELVEFAVGALAAQWTR